MDINPEHEAVLRAAVLEQAELRAQRHADLMNVPPPADVTSGFCLMAVTEDPDRDGSYVVRVFAEVAGVDLWVAGPSIQEIGGGGVVASWTCIFRTAEDLRKTAELAVGKGAQVSFWVESGDDEDLHCLNPWYELPGLEIK